MKILKRIIFFIVALVLLLALVITAIIFERREVIPNDAASVDSHLYDEKYSNAALQAENWLQEIYSAQGFPSVSAAVGIDGQLVWAGAVGFSDIEEANHATVNTTYRIGSISKSLTATALMVMHEQKVLDINKSFSTYAPEVAAQWPDFSLYQLATHQAGIRHYPKGLDFYRENFSNKEYPTTASAVTAINQEKLLFTPGTDFYYSTYGYTLLALAMENASGKSFETLMQDYLFSPAQMNTTILDKAERKTDSNAATPYMQVDQTNYRAPDVNLSYKYAAGGYLSTPSDIVRFGNALFNGLLSTNTREQLWHVSDLPKKTSSEDYAIGFFRANDAIGLNLNHGGKSVGGLSYLVIYPEQQMVIVITTNTTPMGKSFSRAQAARDLGMLFK
jgi:serine beta-lactamase-like protein LACTB, mitochondrial